MKQFAVCLRNETEAAKILIFIEGVSGIGKTTLVKRLQEYLTERGYVVRSYLEFDYTNPIDFYCTAYFKQNEYENLLEEYHHFSDDLKINTITAEDIRLVRYYNEGTPLFKEPLLDTLRQREFNFNPINLVPLSEYTRVFKMVWSNLALKSSGQHDCLIFDGSLLHHPINDLMRNYNASCEQIIHHVNALIETVALLDPQLFYLTNDDVAERLIMAHKNRKQPPPSADEIKFWESRKQMDISVLPNLSIKAHIIKI